MCRAQPSDCLRKSGSAGGTGAVKKVSFFLFHLWYIISCGKISYAKYKGGGGQLDKSLVIRDLLRKLNKTFRTIVAKELAEFNLTIPQFMVLKEIIHEPKTIGQISQAVDLSYSTVSGIIDRLEREQLVERVRDQEDRRVIWIQKTEKFVQLKKQIPFTSEEFYAQLLQGVSEQEQDTIIHSLQTLITKLEAKAEEKP
jgi:DNA-binding MarR family transcriptional regulator